MLIDKVDISLILFTISVMKSNRAPNQTADEKKSTFHAKHRIALAVGGKENERCGERGREVESERKRVEDRDRARERAKIEKERGKVLKWYSFICIFSFVIRCGLLLLLLLLLRCTISCLLVAGNSSALVFTYRKINWKTVTIVNKLDATHLQLQRIYYLSMGKNVK